MTHGIIAMCHVANDNKLHVVANALVAFLGDFFLVILKTY
jgi:hypothetical protein